MATKVISFYDKFKCIASDCPSTCCRGWRISIDEETVSRYKKEPGKEGMRLKATMTFGKNKDVRKFFGRCANETKDGLCRLELMGRQELMPEVCRIYPRRSIKIGDDLEVTFELSCPVTAELFLENVNNIRLIDYDGEEIDPVWIQDKFNEKYYNDILKVREKVIDFIKSDIPLPEIMNNLYLYYRKLHSHVMQQDIDITSIPISGRAGIEDKGRYNFYSIAIIDKVIMNDLDDGRFRSQDPLRDFRKEYNRIFGQMTADEADRFFHRKCEEMAKAHPALSDKYKAYLSYYTFQMIYASYETVTFYKEYLMGIVYLMVLMLTDLVDYVNLKDMEDIKRQVNNLNAAEKRLRHNVSVKKNIQKRIEREFIKEKEGYKF